MVGLQPVGNGTFAEQRPDGRFRTVPKTLDVIQIDAVTFVLQILLVIVLEIADTAAHHHIEVVVDHLRDNNAVTTALVRVCGTVGGGGMRELASENQTGRFMLEDFGGLQNRSQRLVSAIGINGHQIVVRGHRIGGNKTGL